MMNLKTRSQVAKLDSLSRVQIPYNPILDKNDVYLISGSIAVQQFLTVANPIKLFFFANK